MANIRLECALTERATKEWTSPTGEWKENILGSTVWGRGDASQENRDISVDSCYVHRKFKHRNKMFASKNKKVTQEQNCVYCTKMA